jgi:transposase
VNEKVPGKCTQNSRKMAFFESQKFEISFTRHFCLSFDNDLWIMPRKLTESAKKRRLEKQQRKVEKSADVPDHLKQSTIEFLHRIGKEAKEIIEFTQIAKTTVYDCINRIKDTGSAKPKPRSGRPLTATSKENVIKARKIISKNPESSRTELAKKLKISKDSVTTIVRKKLKSRFYRMGRGQLLTDKHKQSRLEKAKKLLNFITEKPEQIYRVMFTDEKIFQIRRYHNRQNHRQVLGRITKHRRWRTIGHTRFPKSVMVWGGVSGMGKTKLGFIERGVKINSAYYQTNVLKKRALTDGRKIFGRKRWWFQQD